jgi:hypothetical protein
MNFFKKIFGKQEQSQKVDLSDVLYTTPTIENTFPEVEYTDPPSFKGLTVHEDDWRQIEFVSTNLIDLVAEEIASIQRIFEDQSKEIEAGLVFKETHLRTKIPKPITLTFPIDSIEKHFHDIQYGDYGFYDGSKAKFGRELKTLGFQLYVIVVDNLVQVLGFHGLDSWDNLDEFKKCLKDFMEEQDLVIVDWRARLIIKSNELDKYLKKE